MHITMKQKDRLLRAISQAHEQLHSGMLPEQVLPQWLDVYIELSASELGFIGIVHEDPGSGYRVELRALADKSACKSAPRGRPLSESLLVEWNDAKPLLDALLQRREPVIVSGDGVQPLIAGLPAGHVPMRSFMVLPFQYGDRLVGFAGVANGRQGYDAALASFLDPLLRTHAQLIPALDSVRDTSRLAEKEALYRTLFDLLPDAVVTIRDGRYVDCNRATLELLGLRDTQELRESQVGSFSPPLQPDGRPSASAIRQLVAECLQGGSVWFDWVYQTRDGREFPARVYLKEVNPGNPSLLQAVIHDVSFEHEAEARLRAQREYFATVLEGSPLAIMVTDIESGAIRFANRAANEMLGLDGKAGTGVGSLWVDPAERDRFLAEFAKNGRASGEARLRRPDGSEFDARIDWQRNPGTEGEVLCWSVDISERMKVLQRLHYHEQMLQLIMDHVPVALFCKDINDDFRYTMANPVSGRFLGVDSATMIGRTDFDLAPPERAMKIREQDVRLVETGIPLEVTEELFEPSPGEVLYGHHIKLAVPDRQGKPAFIVGFCADITEQREAARALQASERRFRELAEHAPVGIFLTDPRGAFVFVNRQWQVASGLDQNGAAAAGWMSAVHPEDRPDVESAWAGFVQFGGEFAMEFRFRPPVGDDIWVYSKAVPFRNDAGAIVGFFGTTTDISERKRFEKQLKLSRDEAQRANQAKSEFLSRMSHELRTPLNAVLGFGQLLEMDGQSLSASQNEGVAHILAGGEHLLALIDDVLDLSRIDAGHMSMRIQRRNLAEPLERALSMVRVMAEKYGIVLDPPVGPLPRIVADPNRLQQVLVNLLSNAIKYNRPGGAVRIRQEPCADGMVRLGIEDTGPGIRIEDQQRLFVPFERIVDPTRTVEGTGIGLSICKRLMELMAGKIGFHSEFGSGSTFWVELPAGDFEESADDPQFRAAGALADAKQLEGLRLLYVEDHMASIRLLSELARRVERCELLAAMNGTDGIALAKTARPDVILMDLNMPGLSGYDTLSILRKDERTRGIPAIALSAGVSAGAVESSRLAGFQGFLPKPLSLGGLIATVVSTCRESGIIGPDA